ncbi:hypothetical protein L218DRAFT_1006800 [Marasmius fiardii PR-910]|nr:hypothetical protein L218DRAFT_1006800 [Marasmius fiardii PR-910]
MYSPPMQSSKSKHASTNAINANRIAGGNFYSAAAEQTINNSPQVQNNAQGCSTTIVNNYYQSIDSAQQHLNNRGTARGEEAAMVPTDKEVNQVRTCFPSNLPASSAEQGHNDILPPHLPRGGINTNMTDNPNRSTCLVRRLTARPPRPVTD